MKATGVIKSVADQSTADRRSIVITTTVDAGCLNAEGSTLVLDLDAPSGRARYFHVGDMVELEVKYIERDTCNS